MRNMLLALLIVVSTLAAQAQATTADAAVRAVLNAQVAAWNRGDLDGFMAGYENSPQTTFVGSKVTHGWADVLAHYREHYSSRELMGTLSFSELEVRQLDDNIAVCTGRFQLARTAGKREQDTGIFSLVFRRNETGWHIVLDHTA